MSNEGWLVYDKGKLYECKCEKCGKQVDRADAHLSDYGNYPGYLRYALTCKDCMRKYGNRCAKCGEYFYGSEGLVVQSTPTPDSPPDGNYTKKQKECHKLYGGQFLCQKCYNKENYDTETVVSFGSAKNQPRPIRSKELKGF